MFAIFVLFLLGLFITLVGWLDGKREATVVGALFMSPALIWLWKTALLG